MPTYQYQCTECGDGLEVVQKFTDDSLTECPSCEGRLKKVFSAVGIVFKGSGFYRNDSRSSASSSSSAGSNGEKSGSEKSEKAEKSEKSGASESKGEKKSDGGSSSSSSSSTSTTASSPAA